MSAAIDLNPQRAARDLFRREIAAGWKPAELWPYEDADGRALFYKVRLDPPGDEAKLIRPMHLSGERWTLGLPPKPAAGWPLYRLGDVLASDAVVYICEGEKATEALRRLGVTATTSGSATSDAGADWTPLQGRSVRLWPDNDKAGTKYADDVATRLHVLGCAVDVLDVAEMGLPAKADAADWTGTDLDALPWRRWTPAVTGGVVESQESHSGTSAPEPLRRPVPPPEPYPMAKLGPILSPACESLRRVIQAPDAICGASLLAAASLAVQGLANVEHHDRVYPLSLWFLTVAESGERKSAVDSEAMRSAREVEREMAQEYEADCIAHEAEQEQWTVQKDIAKSESKKGKGVGLADALRKLGPQPPPPLRPTLIAADFTAEGLAKLLAAGRPTIGAFTDEAALVLVATA